MSFSNTRLQAAFAGLQGRTALIPYVTSGDPSRTATVPLMHAMVRAGADIIELGVPFSDPMADGSVIQKAAERAIAKGTGLAQVLEMVSDFRRDNQTTPVVLMGYANPIERMGQEAFAERASQAGVDGILVVDYPPEECVEFAALLGQAGIDPIFLLAPTSTEARIRQLAQVARGYVYYVSLRGVTGSGNLDVEEVAQRLEFIRRHISIPVGVGFGIRDAQSARRLAQVADAVIIGTKLIQVMEEAVAGVAQADQNIKDQAAAQAAEEWLGGIRAALDKPD